MTDNAKIIAEKVMGWKAEVRHGVLHRENDSQSLPTEQSQ